MRRSRNGTHREQTGADNLVDTIFEGLQEQSRLNITNELRRFIEVDNQEAVKIGDLENNSEAINVVRPQFNKRDLPERGRPGKSGPVDTSKR